MIDLSKTLDMGTNFPDTWKTLVREVLLKFEDGITYHHDNIVGNRPFHVDLKITIDDPVDDETYEELHRKSGEAEEKMKTVTEFMELITDLMTRDDVSQEDIETFIGELSNIESKMKAAQE